MSNLCTLSKIVADADIVWALNCFLALLWKFKYWSKWLIQEDVQWQWNCSNLFNDRVKIQDVTTFGLGPYFAKKLLYNVKQAPAHAPSFDESQNEEMQSKQLNARVRYWSSENVSVESRHLTSLFIVHGRTGDILKHFEEATKDLDPVKTWNIDQNVNLAFERELRKSREESNLLSLLCLGTCGLHTVHRSFQTGAKETNWDLDQYLLKEYKLFKHSPLDVKTMWNTLLWIHFHLNSVTTGRLHISLLNSLYF